MPNTMEARQDRQRNPNVAVAMCGMAMILAASCALIFGLLGPLNLVEQILLMFAAAALGGGALFTVLTMHRLGKED